MFPIPVPCFFLDKCGLDVNSKSKSSSKSQESAKLGALCAHEPMYLTCLHDLEPTCLVCLRTKVSCVLTCSYANVHCVLCIQTCLACFACSCGNVPCVLCVATCSRTIKIIFQLHVFLTFLWLFFVFFLWNKTVVHSSISLTRWKFLTGAMINFVLKKVWFLFVRNFESF